MFRRKRISGAYVIEQHGDCLLVSHQPRWLLYVADRDAFYEMRRRAHQQLALLLGDESFWPGVRYVTSRSLTIDFARDGVAQHDPVRWYDKPGFLMLWLCNIRNWRWNRLAHLRRVMRLRRVSSYKIERQAFVRRWEGG